MKFGERLKAIRKKKGLTQVKVAEMANISRSYLADIEHDRYNPSLSVLGDIAEVLGVSLDKLTGNSIGAIIEERLELINMNMNELAEKTKVSIEYLQNIDEKIPEPWDYTIMDKLAQALKMNPGILRAALARQEPPAYDGHVSSVEEDFADVDLEEDFVNEGNNIFTKPNTDLPPLTAKDERDIARDLERLLNDLESEESLAFDGEPLEMDDETRELLRHSLESSMRLAKQIAKQKFTPKKYRK